MKHLTQLILFILLSNVAMSQTTVISFNIRYDNPDDTENSWISRRDKMIKLVDYYEPSFLGIQEGLKNQVQFLDSSLVNYNYIGVGRQDGKIKGEYSALFYNKKNYKLIKGSTFWLSETPDKPSVGWDAALERICTYGLFENTETKERLWVFNTHFDHMGKLARKNSAHLILEKIKQLNTEGLPLVLMGDFNATPEDEPIQILRTGLDDALSISAKPLYGPAGTFNGFTDKVMTDKIDHFFVDHVKVLSYAHIDDRLDNNKFISDHLPIMMVIEVSEK